ncbi:MAG: DUF4118 domain-containing protein [Sphingomonas fennica]
MTTAVTRLLERLPLLEARPVAAYALAIALSLVAAALRELLDPVFPPGYPYLTFFPAVILSSFFLGRGPGTAAALLCGALAWYFFIPPFRSLEITPRTGVALAFYAGVVAVDIALVHWMQRANRHLRTERERTQMLAERSDLLFRELQHRVSNNLQMIGAVLSLQRRGVTDPAAAKALQDAASKLALIGSIQRQLYDGGGGQVAPGAFLRQLADDLLEAGGKPGIAHHVSTDETIALDPDGLIPLALIMAEATANSIEHGFAEREDGRIAIELTREADDVVLRVADDGAGLPPGFALTAPASLGLRIATTLARQLGGRFSLSPRPDGGTIAELRFAG